MNKRQLKKVNKRLNAQIGQARRLLRYNLSDLDSKACMESEAAKRMRKANWNAWSTLSDIRLLSYSYAVPGRSLSER